MANNIILAVILFGGLLGWLLYIVTVIQIFFDRRKKLQVIQEIQEDIKIVKQEIKTLK